MKHNNAIIIPVHNRKEMTLSCLDHLYRSDLEATIFLVDDGSTDGTSEAISELYPDVQIVCGDGNLFWTGGIALGMRKAYERGAEVFVWLNDDTLIDPHGLHTLIEKVTNDPKRVVAPLCFKVNDDIDEIVHGGCIGSNCFRITPIKGVRGEDKQVEMMSGYCVVFSRQVIETIGFPDAEQFPHYAGDSSYTLMAHRNGFELCICGEAELQLTDFHSRNMENYIRGGSNMKSFDDVFRNKNSPYRLKTLRNIYRLRYGYVRGIIIYFIIWARYIIKFYSIKGDSLTRKKLKFLARS